MSNKGTVVSVNVSIQKGTVKKPVPQGVIDAAGIVGDAHAGPWQRQVSLLSQEQIDAFSKEAGRKILPGEFAENITVSGIDLNHVGILDRFRIGQAELEVAQVGKKCHGDSCAIYKEVGKCVMPHKGIFCRVLSGGTVKPGDILQYVPKVLTILIFTLSDRAFSGVYTDRSGPHVEAILQGYFVKKGCPVHIDKKILSDDASALRETLTEAINGGADVIFTCGGTGVGPRDITPETVESVCDKTIPGIMENIRMKYGQEKPSVFLSRSIAAIAGKTQIYTLPGSVRAVQEYMTEILKTLEHAVLMIHGIDAH